MKTYSRNLERQVGRVSARTGLAAKFISPSPAIVRSGGVSRRGHACAAGGWRCVRRVRAPPTCLLRAAADRIRHRAGANVPAPARVRQKASAHGAARSPSPGRTRSAQLRGASSNGSSRAQGSFSATRSTALLARGLALTSSAPGLAGRPMMRRFGGGSSRAFTGRRSGRAGRAAPRMKFFTIAAEPLPDLGLVRLFEPLERAWALRRVHAHVERSVRPEAEAAPRVVELRRGHAQIEQHPIDTARAQRVERRLQFAEARMDRDKARVAYLTRSRDRFPIPVHPDQPASGPQPLQNQPAVTASAESPVHERAVVP